MGLHVVSMIVGALIIIITLSVPISLVFLLIHIVRKRRKSERVVVPKRALRLLRFCGVAGFALIVCVGFCWGYDSYEDLKSIETGETNLRNIMKDPGAVQFKNVRVIRFCRESGCFWYQRKVCGEFNAKNAFGAYGGFQQFIIAATGQPLIESDEPDDFPVLWTAACERDCARTQTGSLACAPQNTQ